MVESVTYNPLGDSYSSLELIASTEMVANSKFKVDQMPLLAARVSTAREGKTGVDAEADSKLLDFLARHKHVSPFEHQYLTYRVVCPLFVAREWQRHRTLEGFWSFNEMSMRYTDDPVGKFFIPETVRKQGTRNKQGSDEPFDNTKNVYFRDLIGLSYEQSLQAYKMMEGEGVARELARTVVPVGNYTEFYVTGSIRTFDMFCILRKTADAQAEIRAFADALDQDIGRIYPQSWSVLRRNRNRLESILESEYPEVWARLVAEKKV